MCTVEHRQTINENEVQEYIIMKRKFSMFISLITLFLMAGSSTAGAQQQTAVDPQGQVSQVEVEDLVYMREEEKLARDTYLVLGEQWGLKVFANIAKSEQRHMDALKVLLDAFGIDDPVADETDVGIFANGLLQVLYNDLVAQGMQSGVDALKAGGAIEETDILDLLEAIERAENPDVTAVYENLLCGSRNHLRAFVRQIELSGEVYQPVLMTDGQLSAIVDFPTERGCGMRRQGGDNGTGNGAGNSYGTGTGNGNGKGAGNGNGAGNGAGNGTGNGTGNGAGNGSCDGTGTGVPGENCIGG